jgi:hypothetical protein
MQPRRISRQLTVHYKRDRYLLEDSVENRRLRSAMAGLSEDAQSRVTIRANGRVLAARRFAKGHTELAPGTIVEHKHLDNAFAWIAAQQQARDAQRLASRKLTLREKQLLRAPLPADSCSVTGQTEHFYLGGKSGHFYFVLTSAAGGPDEVRMRYSSHLLS